MVANRSRPAPPSDDKRWKIVETAMRRNGYAPDGLIEVLHAVQQSFGCLDTASLRYVSSCLRLPPAKVYGVATFYQYFTLRPAGEHTCTVCMGTACYIKGSSELLARLREKYAIEAGDTTEDGEISLLTARCLGACSLAPAVVLDDEVHGTMDPDKLEARLEGLVTR